MNVEAACHVVRRRGGTPVETVIVLGSGLGGVAESVAAACSVDVREVPGYAAPGTAGHRGRLVVGMLAERPILLLQGRSHLYEGVTADQVAFPICLAHALGARSLITTCSAGAINRTYAQGMLMVMADHIRAGLRSFPGRRKCPVYDAPWRARVLEEAGRSDLPVVEGTYLWTLGPSYETPAEIRYFARLGADAVGMSTVPEVLQARALGMRVFGFALITNPAAGLAARPLDHADVLQAGRGARLLVERLVTIATRAA